jgi:signal transduction histidine kinase
LLGIERLCYGQAAEVSRQPGRFAQTRSEMVSGVPPLFPWVASFLYLAVMLAHLYYWWMGLCGDEMSPVRTGALVGLLALLLVAEPYATRPRLLERSRWTPIALLATRIVLYEVVATLECAGFSKFLYLLVPFQAYFSLGKRAGYALALAYLGILLVRFSSQDPMWYLRDAYVSVLLIFVVGVAFVVVMARALQDQEVSRARAEQLLRDLERSHAQLRASAAQVAELAAAEERNRLARDIHDSLGHHLTAISVQLEKAQAYRARSPDESNRAVQEARHSAQAALSDVRQSVSALRTTGQAFSLRAALTELAARTDDARFTIDLQVEGDEAGFAQPVLMALYRAAQEGLTNVYRHAAGARRVTLHVTMSEDGASLSLGDDGCGFDPGLLSSLPPDRHDRFGLQGARERVELAGGWMRIESSTAPEQARHQNDPTQPGPGTRLLIWMPRRLPAVSSNAGSHA